MIVKPLRIGRIAAKRLLRPGKPLAIQAKRPVEVAASLGDVPHQGQRPTALGKPLVRQVALVLPLIVSEHPAPDRVQRIEPPDGLEPVLQIADHEPDQPLGLAPLVTRHVARLDRGQREPARHHHPQNRASGNPGESPLPPLFIPLDQIVERDVEQSRDQLEQSPGASVRLGPQVRRNRLGRFARRSPQRIAGFAKRGRKAFLALAAWDRACPGLAGNDRRKHLAVGAESPELADFLVHPAALRCGWRTEHDQMARTFDCLANFLAQILRRGEFAPVAEHRGQPGGHQESLDPPPDQCLWHPEFLDCPVKPLGIGGIAVAIAQERPISLDERCPRGPLSGPHRIAP